MFSRYREEFTWKWSSDEDYRIVKVNLRLMYIYPSYNILYLLQLWQRTTFDIDQNFNFKGSNTGEVWRNGGFQLFFNKTSDEPCSFKSFQFFMKMLDVKDNKECKIAKVIDDIWNSFVMHTYFDFFFIIFQGNSSTSPINPNIYTHTFLGGKFFYGKAKTTTSFYTEKGLMYCLHVESILMPIVTERKLKNKSN